MEYIAETFMGFIFFVFGLVFQTAFNVTGELQFAYGAILMFLIGAALFLPVCVNIIRDLLEKFR